ncbi:hypothetical protein HYH03_002249 [Edaphochlamys debaryana]|uniref:Uncharacterized protein n=1 Tax=Edaphochlamys debaryana TaxID=47281 RepID=A0A835YDY9_9CHLO|nr:hypothetical protein HYH03_002249 [Edaphochlamys debaryana]|eukprot:KAG2499964.1 hypothetical protein HYH03_002249 [Edaphochlamys debaryana]
MGSLMPGWDTAPGVPQAMRDDFDKPQEEGYFARLRSHRASGGGGPFEAAGTQSLSRNSAPLHDLGSGTGLPHAVTMPRQIGAGGGAGGAAKLGTASSMPRPGAMASPPHHNNPLAPHKYHFTDWTEELSSLRKPGAKPGSLGHATELHHGSPGPHDKHSAAWWRALEVGHLNEQPDTQAEADRHTSSYVPQFKPSTKLDFGEVAEEEAATAK